MVSSLKLIASTRNALKRKVKQLLYLKRKSLKSNFKAILDECMVTLEK